MAEEKPKSGSPTGILNSSEIQAAFAGYAAHVDRFIVTTNQAGVRIGFLEADTVSRNAHFRAAVILSYPDAIELAKLLRSMLADVEKKIVEATGTATGSGSASGASGGSS